VPWYRAVFRLCLDPAHRDRGVVRSGPRAVRAGGIQVSRRGVAIRLRQLWWIRSDARGSGPEFPQVVLMSDPPRLTRAGRAFPGSTPTSDVPMSFASTGPWLQSKRSAHRAPRYRSYGFHLQTRTAAHEPGEEPTLERFRTPSVVYGPDTLITCRPLVSWRPVKDAARRLHTHLPSLVSPHAFNVTTTSLGLEAHDLA